MGGAEIYRLALDSGFVNEIYLTTYDIDIVGETVVTFAPDTHKYKLSGINSASDKFSLKLNSDTNISKDKVNLQFEYYTINFEPFETQYLCLINEIYACGVEKICRNGSTLSLKDRKISIDLANGFPILTTRKSFWRGIKEELLWMMSGSTDTNILSNKGIHIWDGNSRREYLDQIGLTHLAEGDIGPGYGFQMRYAGATYGSCGDHYENCGFDQLKECVRLIKTNFC